MKKIIKGKLMRIIQESCVIKPKFFCRLSKIKNLAIDSLAFVEMMVKIADEILKELPDWRFVKENYSRVNDLINAIIREARI